MADAYTYQIDRYVHAEWHTEVVAEDQTVEERSAEQIARAILEDWVVDHPSGLAGGGRIAAYSGGPYEEDASVRVLIFPGRGAQRQPTPSASAYLLSDPNSDDPHSWVNF